MFWFLLRYRRRTPGSENIILFQNIVFLGRKSKTLNLYTRKTKQSSCYYNHNMLNVCFYGIKGTMVFHMWQALFLMKNIMKRSLCFWPVSMCVREHIWGIMTLLPWRDTYNLLKLNTSCPTNNPIQTLQTQTRLLLNKQSNKHLPCLLYWLAFCEF